MHQNIKRQTSNNSLSVRGFSLVELLVVIAIIVVLLGILIPVVSKVRKAAWAADTQQLISTIAAAVERYRSEIGAYPGPFSNDQIYTPATDLKGQFANFQIPPTVQGFDTNTTANNAPEQRLTMAENLVLGLLGGLRVDSSTGNLEYNPSLVGQGPQSLNPLSPKRYNAYIDGSNLSWRVLADGKTGDYADAVADCPDSIIPEFVDKFPDALPILYLRARSGADGVVSLNGGYQYDLNQIIGYTGEEPGTGRYIGVGKSLKGDQVPPRPENRQGLNEWNVNQTMDPTKAIYTYPYTIVPYLKHPTIAPTNSTTPALQNSTGTPRAKDGFILISAGADRVFGSNDDITNVGNIPQ